MAKKWAEVASSDAFKALSPDQQDGARRQYFDQVVAPQVPAEQVDRAWDQFSTDVGVGRRALPKDVAPSLAGAGRGTTMPTAQADEPQAAPQPVTAEKTRAQRIAEMDRETDPINPDYLPITDNAVTALQTDARGGMDAKRTRSPGRVLDSDIEPRTATSVARDVVSGAMQIPGVVAKGVGDLSRMATGDRVGKGLSDGAESVNKAIRENVGSWRAQQQDQRFQQDMQDPALNAADVVVGNPGALSDQMLPTVGSMALPIGSAALAGKLATGSKAAQLARVIDEGTVLARAERAREAAVIGTTVAQNAADTYSTVRDAGGEQGDAYKAAGIAALATAAAGKLTGGGAEANAAHLLAGGKGAVKAIPKAMAKDGAQEMGEDAGQYAGETVGTNGEFDANTAGKRIAVAGTLGAVMGGGVEGAGAAREARIKMLRDAGETAAAELLQQKHDTATAAESVDQELAAMPGNEQFAQTYRGLRTAGVKPAEAAARSAVTVTFSELAQATGIPDDIAAKAVEKAKGLPLEKIPGFYHRFTESLVAMGKIQPGEAASSVGQAIEAARDEAMDAAVNSVYAPVQQAMSDVLSMEGAVSGNSEPVTQNTPVVNEKRESVKENGDLVSPSADVDLAAHDAATSPLNALAEPTDAQKAAGNYKVGRVNLHGLNISIENPEGSVRKGTSPDGTKWENELRAHYGYIRGTEGNDGDHVDTFIGPNPESQKVFVVDQVNKDGTFDEHKVMLGADSLQQADDLYHANYHEGWTGRGAITEMSLDQFKRWVKDGPKTEPVGQLPKPQQTPADAGVSTSGPETTSFPSFIGRNSIPMSEGGKAFKTRKAADDVRKLNPMMRVVRAEGGYALTEKTPAQIAAQEAAAKRLRQPRTSPNGEPIPAHAMIAAAGGMAPDTRADLGLQGNVQVGNRKLFAGDGKGLSIERATERLIEGGYLQAGASHDDARKLIKRSLTKPQYTAKGTEWFAQREMDARQQAHEDAVADVDPLSDNAINQYSDADIPWDAPSNSSEADFMRAMGFSEQEIQDATTTQRSGIEGTHGQSGFVPEADAPGRPQEVTGQRAGPTGEDSRGGGPNEQPPRPGTRVNQTPSPEGVSVSGAIHRNMDVPTGTTIVDSQGNEYRVHSYRHDTLIAHPIVDGKAQVNSQSSVRFWTNPDPELTAPGDNDRSDPVYVKGAEPGAFIKAPDGSLDFGEITPEMSKVMRRQAGKIRLTQGVQNADGTGYGLTHIEANHGKQIRSAGFGSATEFVAHVAGKFNEILQASKGKQLLVAVTNGRRDVMFVQLESSGEADFYRVNTAFPASRDYLEKQEGKGSKVLWVGSEPRTTATGRQPLYAGKPEETSGQAAPIAQGQSGASLPKPAPGGKFTTERRADGTLAVKGDAAAIREALKDIPAKSLAPMKGGILVGRTQADKAMAILQPGDLTAPAKEDVLAQQDRKAEQRQQASAERDIEQEYQDLKAEANKWLSRDAEYEGRDFGAEYAAVRDLDGQEFIDVVTPILDEFKAARARFFAPNRAAIEQMQENERSARANLPQQTDDDAAFNGSPERAIQAMTPVQREAMAKELGIKRGKKTETAFIEALASGPRDQVRAAYLAVMQETQAPDEVPREQRRQAARATEQRIDDFGENLGGAKKDMAPPLTKELTDDDIATQPFSKIWPADEVDGIEDKFAAAVAFAARAEVPAKPRVAYKVARWVENVKMVRGLAQWITSGKRTPAEFMDKLREMRSLKAFGDKVELLNAIDRSQWARIGTVEAFPDAYRFDDAGQKVPSQFTQVEIDGKTHKIPTGSVVAAIERVDELLAGEAAAKKMQFEIRRNTKTGEVFINKKGDKEYRKLKTFADAKQARAFISDNYDDLVAAWESVKEIDNVKKTDVRSDVNRARTGADRRNGKDVTPEQFSETFGFRGVEFGNWVGQGANGKERQGMLNQAYDALLDLADIVGIPPKAISLNGSMGLAFGSRGSGKAAAHFEPDNLVINLTKTKGAGSLAHEWFHALDNYFARQRGGEVPIQRGMNAQQAYRANNFITYRPEPLYIHKSKTSTPITKAKLQRYHEQNPKSDYYNPDNWQVDPKHPNGVRPEVERAFAELVEALDQSPMSQRAASLDKTPEAYWSRVIERAARAFENFVISKMMEQGYQNDYLANVRPIEDFPRSKDRYPYLLPEEVAPIAESFGNLFGTIQTKETDKGVAMFARGAQTESDAFKKWSKGAKLLSPEQSQDHLFMSGEPVVVDAFHGTTYNDITQFGTTRESGAGKTTKAKTARLGAFFTDERRTSDLFSAEGEGEAPTVYRAYVRFDNPLNPETVTADEIANMEREFPGFTDSLVEVNSVNSNMTEASRNLARKKATKTERIESDSRPSAMRQRDARVAELESQGFKVETQFWERSVASVGYNLTYYPENLSDGMKTRDFFAALQHIASDQDARQKLEKLGYDGIIVRTEMDTPRFKEDRDGFDMFADENRFTGRIHQFIAFHPEQIKSATGNSGNFDPANPDIRYALGADAFRLGITPRKFMPVSEVQKAVDQLSAKWTDGPTIKVVQSAEDLPIDAPEDARGLIHNGTAYIVAANHTDRAGVAKTLAHEAIGHYGLWQMLGEDGRRQFERNIKLALASGNKPLKAISARVRELYVDESGKFNLTPEEEANEIAAFAVEEALDADGNFKPGFGFFKQVWAKVAEFLRSKGFDIKFTNAELQGMLVSAMQGLAAGQRLEGGGETLVAAARDAGNLPEQNALREISGNDEMFQYPVSYMDTVEGITAEIAPHIKVRKLTNIPGETRYVFETPDGNTQRMMVRPHNPYANEDAPAIYGYDLDANHEMTGIVTERPGKNSEYADGKDDVYVDVSLMRPGERGAAIYAIAANYAHNTGKVFIGDPAGLSDHAMKRRVEQMLSSALKFGTTDHLAPHPRQVKGGMSIGVPALNWTYGDDLGNIKSLIRVSNAIYGNDNPITFEPVTGRYLDSEGVELDDDAISLVVRAGRERAPGIGMATAKRNAVLSALVSKGDTGSDRTRGRDQLLEKLLDVGREFPAATSRIFYARGVTPNLFAPKVWDTPDATRTDKIIYELQDGRVDLKRVQQAIEKSGQQIKEQWDARLAESLYPGRVAYRSQQFLDTEVKTLLSSMANYKVPMDELADYLHARGAEERNAQVAKVNPDLPDGGAGRNSKGMLMTNDAARDYLANVTPLRKQVLDALAKQVDAITKGTRKLLVAEGLEKQETIDAWESAYKNYVPMFRDEAQSGSPHPQGTGFTVKGSASKRATGSTKEVTNILAHVLMQREAAITRAEKNRVALALYGQALSHPNPEFWTTIKPSMKAADISAELVKIGVDPATAVAGMDLVPTITTVDPNTGKKVNRPNPMYKSLPGAITLKVHGEDRVLMLNVENERGARMAESLKNLDGLTKLDLASSIVGKSTRWLASVNTQYNPAFGLVNLTRDTLGGVVNLRSTALRGNSLKVLANTPVAIFGIARELARGGQTGKWQALYRQFQADGGQTGWRENFRDAGDRAKAIESELAGLQKTGKLTAVPGRVAHAILDLLDGFNTTLENAVRLSAYKAALDHGMSGAEAARLGRELTVDFNRKGRVGREVGPLYAFFNASVQGSARTLQTLNGKDGAMILVGGISLGALQALMLLAAGYDDDEVPEFVKSRSLVIPLNLSGTGEKKHILVPYPLGLHVLPNTGRVITELALSGGKDIGKRSFAAIGEIAGAFNPLGGGNIFTADGALKTAAPTLVDPLIEIGFNRNFAGNPIEREARGEADTRPGAARVKESTQRTATGQVYLGISKAINAATGGSDYEAGALSPTPERVRYIAQTVGGGVLREFEKAINASSAASRGDDVKMSQIPVAGRFYGEVDDAQVKQSRYFEHSTQMDSLDNTRKAIIKAGDTDALEKLYQEHPEAALIDLGNKVQSNVSKLNKLAATTIDDPASMREIDAARVETMDLLNQALKDLEQSKPATPAAKIKGWKRELVTQ